MRFLAMLTMGCLAAAGQVWAQAAAGASAAPVGDAAQATSQASAPRPPAQLEALFAMVNPDVRANDASRNGCDVLAKSRRLPPRVLVVLVKRVTCSERYRADKAYLEILYDGQPYYVEESDITTVPARLEALSTRDGVDVAFSREAWVLESKRMTLAAKSEVLMKLQSSKAQGVAVISAGIFDTSEYTEGTGFRAEFYNSGSKTIKYITVGLQGRNAVNDPVRDRFSRATTVTLRGVGPIEAGDIGSYRKDYMWSTDLVESFDIVSVKLEFMDGTSRTIARKQLVWLSKVDRETLLGDED